MIELISEAKIYSPEYLKLRCEFYDVWNKLFLAQNKIDAAIFNRFGKAWVLAKALSLTPYWKYLCVPKMVESPVYSEIILRSNQLWSVRNWEYPWAVLNSKITPDTKILDVGAGHSLFPLYMAQKSNHVDCLDNDKWQMEVLCPALAKILGVKVNYFMGDALNLDIKDNTYDYIYCISVLEHFEEEVINGVRINKHIKRLEKQAIREFLRVIKPKGRVILTLQYGNEKSDKRSFMFDHITDLVKEFKGNLFKQYKDYDHFRFTKKNEDEMSKLIATSFPYIPTKEPTGSMGIILTK